MSTRDSVNTRTHTHTLDRAIDTHTHTTPPTHTGALSYCREYACCSRRRFLDSVGEWLLHRPASSSSTDWIYCVFCIHPTSSSRAGGLDGACARCVALENKRRENGVQNIHISELLTFKHVFKPTRAISAVQNCY